jgi:ABC-type transporter Mla subunit MlaD
VEVGKVTDVHATRTSSGPYLRNGSVIPKQSTSVPQAVGPMLDQVSALIDSVPKDKISGLLDESYKGLKGSGYELGSLFDSSSTLIGDMNSAADQSRPLIDDSRPLLDGRAESSDAIRTWAHSMAGITEQVVANDPLVRNLLQTGPVPPTRRRVCSTR